MKLDNSKEATLYLCAASFEERCLAFPNSLSTLGPYDKFILLDFQGYFNVTQYCRNLAKVRNLLQDKGIKPEIVECWVKYPLHTLTHIKKLLVDNDTWAQVVLDISALPRTYIFLITDYLRTLTEKLVVRYTRPTFYGDELSRGAGWASPIPNFEGSLSPEAEKILFLILGFEGNKSEYVWEILSPKKTIVLIGDPPYELSFIEEAKKRNDFFFNKPRSDILGERIHTSDLESIFCKLESLYLRYFKKEVTSNNVDILVCPLGTKPQSLGTYMFAKKYSDVPIIYVSSAYYFTEKYSKGIGETITYDVSALSKKLGIEK